MRIKKGYIDFNKVISLNESATYLWKNVVDKDFDVETMASLLQQEYEVDAETAKRDAQALLDEWTKVGLTE